MLYVWNILKCKIDRMHIICNRIINIHSKVVWSFKYFISLQAHQAEEEGLGDTVILLQAYLGLAWTLGCVAFGLLVVHHSVECRIARQYLTQAAIFVCGLCILALTAVQGNYHGYVLFAWIYGTVSSPVNVREYFRKTPFRIYI